jgi:hypothetical protein
MKQGWHDAHSTQAAESSPAIVALRYYWKTLFLSHKI